MNLDQYVAAFKEHGSIKAVARNTILTYHAARVMHAQAVEAGKLDKQSVGRKTKEKTNETVKAARPAPEGRVKALPMRAFDLPKKGKVRSFIFTSAQNNTKVHGPLWHNLLALADHYSADIHIARFTYVKSGLGARGDKAQVTKKEELYGAEDMWWDAKLVPYLSDERAEVAPGLVWCGEMNILPTAVNPLSDLQSYTGRSSGVFPHVKIAMESVASGKWEATKFNYTTGTVTLRNYIQRKAGLKAEFHHCYAALLVEVDHEGNWFCRQLNADSEGVIHDLDAKVARGKVTTGHRVEAVSWGDVHVAGIDHGVRELAWGSGGMLDALRPKRQFIHDVFDFMSRNPHERKNPHAMFDKHVRGVECVEGELRRCARFLQEDVKRRWCDTVVVESNHDNMLERWLRDDPAAYAKDPLNAVLFLELQLAKYEALAAQDAEFLLIKYALRVQGRLKAGVAKFLGEDESFIICHDKHGGIECGMHGHMGPNGARGNPAAFARMGRKANVGHSHSAGIKDGVYVAGFCGEWDQGYNKGPSSWSHSHIVTYPNGKRAIITMWNGKWRA